MGQRDIRLDEAYAALWQGCRLVAKSATTDERNEIGDASFDGCHSLARTCEISMQDTMGRIYESLPYLVDETIS